MIPRLRALAAASAAAILAATGCSRPDDTPPPPRPVRTMVAGEAAGATARTFPGRAEATQSTTLSARVGGPLVELPITLGMALEEGDLVARIDPRDFQTEVRQVENSLAEAEAVLRAMRAGARAEDIRALESRVESAASSAREAQRNLERVAQLVEQGVASQSELDAAESRLAAAEAAREEIASALDIARAGARPEDIDAAEARASGLRARLDAARAALADTEIRAPFAGRVAERFVDNFQIVRPQQPIATLQDSSRIEVRIGVPETAIIMAGYVTGIICRFEAFPGLEFPAEMKEIGTTPSGETQTFPVVVAFDNPPEVGILPGMSATVEIRADLPEESPLGGIQIPTMALVSMPSGESAVWIVDERAGIVRRRTVRTGGLAGGGILVVEGIEAGEVVVTAGANTLHDGQRVRVAERP